MELKNKILFTIYAINEFATRNGLTDRSSYAYLSRYNGIDFLDENYEAEHLLSMDDTIADLTLVCKRNGGGIA